MSNDPRPEDDEEWTVGRELEGDTADEENLETEDDDIFGYLSRRQALGVGAAALGVVGGVVGTAHYWGGGNVPVNTTNTTGGSRGLGVEGNYTGIPRDRDISDIIEDDPEDTPTPTTDEETPEEDIDEDTGEEDVTEEEDITEEGNVYELEDGVTVDLDSLDPVFENSGVDIGVQENGNLVAWNQNVEIEGEDGNTYSPLYRFRSEIFPDREFYEIEGSHPIEQIYSELEEDIDEMSEAMVNVFYDEDQDEGSWEDHREFKHIDYQELKDGLLEYSGLGPTQDYFFNRLESMRTREAELEEEWAELVKDGLEAN